jgi:hypothetical protein
VSTALYNTEVLVLKCVTVGDKIEIFSDCQESSFDGGEQEAKREVQWPRGASERRGDGYQRCPRTHKIHAG